LAASCALGDEGRRRKNYQKRKKGLPKKSPAISFLQETKETIA
jgi:hypothetical protein